MREVTPLKNAVEQYTTEELLHWVNTQLQLVDGWAGEKEFSESYKLGVLVQLISTIFGVTHALEEKLSGDNKANML